MTAACTVVLTAVKPTSARYALDAKHELATGQAALREVTAGNAPGRVSPGTTIQAFAGSGGLK